MKRFAHGLVLGKFYPFHAGHQLLIRTASAQCERLTVQVLASSAESIPLHVRVAWIREEHPEVNVVGGMDEATVDFDSAAAWDVHMEVIEGLLDSPVDAAFTSDAYGAELARRLGARWVQVNPGRVEMPVSGTAVRADVAGHWWALPAPVRAWLTRRVVVLGAESTGTTTLSRDLAAELGCRVGARVWPRVVVDAARRTVGAVALERVRLDRRRTGPGRGPGRTAYAGAVAGL